MHQMLLEIDKILPISPFSFTCNLHWYFWTEVIDLTNDGNESEDIQKAIAASLADSGGPYTQETSGILGGQVSREEQDISR